jgi:hypothetical protein
MHRDTAEEKHGIIYKRDRKVL